jgi:signal transduction histidine kinase
LIICDKLKKLFHKEEKSHVYDSKQNEPIDYPGVPFSEIQKDPIIANKKMGKNVETVVEKLSKLTKDEYDKNGTGDLSMKFPHLIREAQQIKMLADRTAKIIESDNNKTKPRHELNQEIENIDHLNNTVKNFLEEVSSRKIINREFLTKIHHDLRTPLVPILAYTDMLLDSKHDPISDEQKKRLGIIRSSTRELVQTIQDLFNEKTFDVTSDKPETGKDHKINELEQGEKIPDRVNITLSDELEETKKEIQEDVANLLNSRLGNVIAQLEDGSLSQFEKWKSETTNLQKKDNFKKNCISEYDRCFGLLNIQIELLELMRILGRDTSRQYQSLLSKLSISSNLYDVDIDDCMPAFIEHVKKCLSECKDLKKIITR